MLPSHYYYDSHHLHREDAYNCDFNWKFVFDQSNQRPTDYDSAALPCDLQVMSLTISGLEVRCGSTTTGVVTFRIGRATDL